MNIKKKIYLIILFSHNCLMGADVNIVGLLNFNCSLQRLPAVWLDCLKHLNVNFVNSRPQIKTKLMDLPEDVLNLVNKSHVQPAKVSIFVDLLWDVKSRPTKEIPKSHIKIAYSMLESSTIPQEWVDILNNEFDLVVVPDEFLIPIYTSSGVKIPIFVLPIALYLEDFFKQKKTSHKVFTFGSSAVFVDRKNHELLIDAFVNEFKNDPKVELIIHGRFEEPGFLKKLEDKIKKLKVKNVKLILKSFSQLDYIDFMSSLSCYVLVSKGEGFSISPREALAMEIPCILTNNTAQSTICKTDLVRSVETPIKEEAFYFPFQKYCGYQQTCNVKDVQKALRDVYDNYENYSYKAKLAKEWVKQYDIKNLKPYHISLVKPEKVILGTQNSIEKNCLITNSLKLYRKYIKLIS